MKQENILGTEKIGKLMRKFSIPCIISLLVNSLYNIVDQIFIGWGVGYLGNGATNVVFPLSMICLAFALMFGDGTSAFLSIKLGEQKKEEASKGLSNGLIISIIVSIIICLLSLIFLPKIINIFGCTKSLKTFSLSYGYIISIGIPFMMIGTTLNSIIRADGNPKYAMFSMLIGALLNIALDPLFIFVFKTGVQGAAIATIISQFVTFLINILYIKRFKSIKITKETTKLNHNIINKIYLLGISSFITQMSIVLVISFENNLLVKYGSLSKYGSDIPITVLGIVMKISQILNSIIIGVSAGSQPILGYNFGAAKYDRVKETLKKVLKVSLIISTIAFILFQTIPDKLIMLFGNGNELYIEFARLSFRIYLLLVIVNGIQIPSGIFFQSIGKSSHSAFISLSRQVLFLIPSMIIFGKIFGIKGILISGPVADGLAFFVSGFLLIKEIKTLNRIHKENNETKYNIKYNTKNNVVITISREYGSGGRYIGKIIAEKLGIKLYDKDFICRLSEETGLSQEYIKENEQKSSSLLNLNNTYYYDLNNNDELFIKESNFIKKISKESCVIIGRCSNYILKDNKNVLKIFIYNSETEKIKRTIKYYGLNKKTALKEINKINKLRSNHYKYYTNSNWNDKSNYDLCINTDFISIEEAANIICNIINEKNKNK